MLASGETYTSKNKVQESARLRQQRSGSLIQQRVGAETSALKKYLIMKPGKEILAEVEKEKQNSPTHEKTEQAMNQDSEHSPAHHLVTHKSAVPAYN